MSDKYIRQSTIIPADVQDKLETIRVAVIGTGAVGRPLCLQLSAVGVKNISIADLDIVEEVNVCTQMWAKKDIGEFKAEVVAREMNEINPDCNIEVVTTRWNQSSFKNNKFDILFNCVDSLSTRLKIFNYFVLRKKVPYMYDARISAEQIQILSVFDKATRDHYPKTIVDDNLIPDNVGCRGIPMIAHSAVIASGLLHQQFVASLNDNILYPWRGMNLMSNELYEIPFRE